MSRKLKIPKAKQIAGVKKAISTLEKKKQTPQIKGLLKGARKRLANLER